MIQAHFDVKVHFATHLFHEQVLDVQFVSPFGESLADTFPITRYSYTAGNQNTFPLRLHAEEALHHLINCKSTIRYRLENEVFLQKDSSLPWI